MSIAVGIAFLIIGIALVVQAVTKPGYLTVFAATVGIFSIGFYSIPLIFRDMGALGTVSDGEVDSVALMALLYFVCVLTGIGLASRWLPSIPALKLDGLDGILLRAWWPTTIIAAAIYIPYIYTTDLTWYAAADQVEYYEVKSPLFAIAAFFANFALAVLALNLALALARRNWTQAVVTVGLFVLVGLRLLTGGQRLLFITPLFMIFMALAAFGKYKLSYTALLGSVLALLIVSPFAVALREARGGGSTTEVHTVDVNYGENPIMTTLQSIVDRGDLLYNNVFMKRYVDRNGYVAPLFYYSVLVVPVPRFLYHDKPAQLSDDGTYHNEASALAWRLVVGDTFGGLTSFGAIVAYREGGWPAVVIDGLADGILFAVLLSWFGKGEYLGKVFFVTACVSFAIGKTPPSFFETLVFPLTYLPMIVALFALDFFLKPGKRRPLSVGTPRVAVRQYQR